MHPDLERLIRLQQLDTFAESARRTIADLPERAGALDRRLASARAEVDSARQRAAANQSARRAAEQELAAQQARLSRYKDQLMEVKTNKEYQAMQHEIASAEREVRSIEDRILDGMEEAEALVKESKQVEARLAAERAEVNAQKRRLEAQTAELEKQIAHAADERAALVTGISADAMAIFDSVARGRSGVAVVEAREGHCSVCNVRLRPQVFLEVRRNDSLIQCESCQRILYFVAPPAGETAAPAES